MQCSSVWKSLNRSIKGEHPLKHPLDQKPAVTVTSGNEREPTNSKKGRAVKRETKSAGHLSDVTTGAHNKCLLYGPGHSSEECKVINIYSENYAVQRPHKSTKARFDGKPKRGKDVEFDENTQESNVMENDDIPIPRNKKGGKVAIKKRKIKSAKAAAAEKDIINVADTVHVENESAREEEDSNGHDSK